MKYRLMGERERLARPEEMATTSTAVATVTPQPQEVFPNSVIVFLIFSIWSFNTTTLLSVSFTFRILLFLTAPWKTLENSACAFYEQN